MTGVKGKSTPILPKYTPGRAWCMIVRQTIPPLRMTGVRNVTWTVYKF